MRNRWGLCNTPQNPLLIMVHCMKLKRHPKCLNTMLWICSYWILDRKMGIHNFIVSTMLCLGVAFHKECKRIDLLTLTLTLKSEQSLCA